MIKKIVSIKDINITDDFKATMPGVQKFRDKYYCFKHTGRFANDIVLDEQGNLVDGYCSYLLAKAFDITKVEVIIKENEYTEEAK